MIIYPKGQNLLSISFALLLLTWTIISSRAWGQSCEIVVTFSVVFLCPNFSSTLRFNTIIITISTCFGAFRVINPVGPYAVSCLGNRCIFPMLGSIKYIISYILKKIMISSSVIPLTSKNAFSYRFPRPRLHSKLVIFQAPLSSSVTFVILTLH